MAVATAGARWRALRGGLVPAGVPDKVEIEIEGGSKINIVYDYHWAVSGLTLSLFRGPFKPYVTPHYDARKNDIA